MTTRSRTLPAVAWSAALATVLLLAGVLAAAPAQGLEEDKVVFHAREGETFEEEYGPIPGQDTIGLFHVPGDCAAAPSCVEIPWEVIVPDDFDPLYNEFIVHVTLSWDDQDFTGGVQQANDLDMYIYDVSNEDEPEEVQSGATASQPENAKVFTPSNRHYAILVSNFAGVNTGFKLEMRFESFAIEEPFFPRDDPLRPVPPSDAEGVATPTTRPAPALDAPAPTAEPVTAPSIAAPVLIEGDGFGSFGTFSEIENELAAPADNVNLLERAVSREPAADVPAFILVIWLVVAPLALLGAALAFLIRRRPVALSLAASS